MKKVYSNTEYKNMVTCYLNSNCNRNAARTLYQTLYSDLPGPRVFSEAYARFNSTGSVELIRYTDNGASRLSLKTSNRIIKCIKNTDLSLRQISRKCGVSVGSIKQVCKEEGIDHNRKPASSTGKSSRPYVAPRDKDVDAQIQFCVWYIENEPNIMWTGTTHFKDDNLNYDVYVWAAIVGKHILGPIFLDKYTGITFLSFLKNTLPDMMDDLPLSLYKGAGLYYQMSGNPVHNDARVREYMNENFEHLWIGRNAPIPWPAQSKNLSPLYLLWNIVTDKIEKNHKKIKDHDSLVSIVTKTFDDLKKSPKQIEAMHKRLSNTIKHYCKKSKN